MQMMLQLLRNPEAPFSEFNFSVRSKWTGQFLWSKGVYLAPYFIEIKCLGTLNLRGAIFWIRFQRAMGCGFRFLMVNRLFLHNQN